MLAAASILGSGGFVPSERRETSALLLVPEQGDAAVVLDAGTGMQRIVNDPGLLQGRTRLDVLLTHFHIDHVCGLAYLFELRDVTVRVHGPGAALYDTPTERVLERIFSPPLMPVGLDAVDITVGELGVGEAEIGGLTVLTRRQDRHSNPTLGMRFGDALTWCTDTEEDPGTVEFARGCRVLAHDAWDPPPAPGHATPGEAARVAAAAEVPVAVLIHVPPSADEDQMRAEAGREHPNAVVATDGLDLLAL